MKRTVFLMLVVMLMASCRRGPDAPSVPSGPPNVDEGSPNWYSSTATDRDGDSVCIRFDWGGDDWGVGWSKYVASGESVSMEHTWSAVGVCAVRAQAKNTDGQLSPWSHSQIVSVMTCWDRTFGGDDDDRGYSVQQTADGGYSSLARRGAMRGLQRPTRTATMSGIRPLAGAAPTQFGRQRTAGTSPQDRPGTTRG